MEFKRVGIETVWVYFFINGYEYMKNGKKKRTKCVTSLLEPVPIAPFGQVIAQV
jgi:hypothetical protein